MMAESGGTGVLYGVQSGATLTLEDFRTLDDPGDARSVRETLGLPLRDRSLYGLTPAGWYRTASPRAPLALTPADSEFLSAHFPLAFQVTLLFGGARDGRGSAAFYVRRPGGSVTPEEDAAVFTFPLAPRVPEPRPPDPAPTVSAAAAPRVPARPTAWGFSAAGLFLFSLVLLPPWNSPKPNPPPGKLGLTVTDEGGRLRITWSPDSRVRKSARGGLLLIREDNQNTDAVMLDRPNPPDGAVLYRPRSPFVMVTLKIYRAEATPAEESVFCLASLARTGRMVFSADSHP